MMSNKIVVETVWKHEAYVVMDAMGPSPSGYSYETTGGWSLRAADVRVALASFGVREVVDVRSHIVVG